MDYASTGQIFNEWRQTRTTYTITSTDVLNGFIPVPITWDVPFADTNYTVLFSIHDLDDTVDLSVGELDVHNVTATGCTPVVFVAAAVPVVTTSLTALNVNTNQSVSTTTLVAGLYDIRAYLNSRGNGSSGQLVQLNYTYTDATGQAASYGNYVGSINGGSGGGNWQNYDFPIYAEADTVITVAAVFPAKVTGSVTSGAFVIGEQVVQATSGATSYLFGDFEYVPTASNPMYLDSSQITGIPDDSHTWVGQTSGAVFTPSSLPTVSAFNFDFVTAITRVATANPAVVPGDQFTINAMAVHD